MAKPQKTHVELPSLKSHRLARLDRRIANSFANHIKHYDQ